MRCKRGVWRGCIQFVSGFLRIASAGGVGEVEEGEENEEGPEGDSDIAPGICVNGIDVKFLSVRVSGNGAGLFKAVPFFFIEAEAWGFRFADDPLNVLASPYRELAGGEPVIDAAFLCADLMR